MMSEHDKVTTELTPGIKTSTQMVVTRDAEYFIMGNVIAAEFKAEYSAREELTISRKLPSPLGLSTSDVFMQKDKLPFNVSDANYSAVTDKAKVAWRQYWG